jgi:phage terminase large subunit GpA-like protein
LRWPRGRAGIIHARPRVRPEEEPPRIAREPENNLFSTNVVQRSPLFHTEHIELGNAWTEDVWGFARRHLPSKLIMVRGRGDDGTPRLAQVRRERHPRTGQLLIYSRRFYHLGVSGLKMALYRDLAKDDPKSPGYVSFPSGPDDEYFQELTAERRMAVKRFGFTVHRWIKDDRQDNEALDTLIQATGAAIRAGVYGLSDLSWSRIEEERGALPMQVEAGAPLIQAPCSPPKRRSIASMLPHVTELPPETGLGY